MALYVYPAVFTSEKEGDFSVNFPDLGGCYTCGDDLKDALMMAEDVLSFTLYDYEADGRAIPKPTQMEDISLERGEFVNYVVCDTLEYAKMHNNKAVKKTLTIPEWLNEAATKKNVNFSQVLQDALMEKVRLGL